MTAMTQIPQTIAETQRLSDGVLLRRFVQDADELAFAIIVERHAGLVMSVCRRVVGQSADCDDAFQATFYALSQRPDSIRDCRSLTGWLYSVAWRTSVRLVRLRKRSKMETLPEQVQSSQPDPLDRIAEANDLAALDEELHQLPDKYRHVLVMNYFAQQSSQEIADQLNESKGTIDGRIREGKRMLRVRLARRGVEIGVLAIATTLTQSASASVSPALISSTTQLAKLSSGFGSMASVPGVDLAQMQVLSSTGTTVMGIKAGTFLATGVLMLSGALGFSQLMARQDGTSPDVSSVAAAVGTTAQDTAATEPLTGEIAATQEGAAKAEANSEAQVSGASAEGSDPFAGTGDVGSGGLGSASGKGLGSGLVGGAAPQPGAVSGPGMGMPGGGGMGMMMGSGMAGPNPSIKPGPTGNGGKAEFSTATSRGVQQRMHQMMYSSMVPATLDFGQNASLREILDQLEIALKRTQHTRFVLCWMSPIPTLARTLSIWKTQRSAVLTSRETPSLSPARWR